MKKAIVFDIDGTLSDASHRLHFIQQEPKDWDGFFGAIAYDKPIEPVRNVCGALMSLKAIANGLGHDVDYDIVFCTGRPEKYRFDTRVWLTENLRIIPEALYMRKDSDHRPDDIVKEELLAQMRSDGYEPFLVFEDRKRVVDMWRRNGIQCCQVAAGDF